MGPGGFLKAWGARYTVEARKLESRDRPLIQERKNTSTNHPKSIFKLFGVYCNGYVSLSSSDGPHSVVLRL